MRGLWRGVPSSHHAARTPIRPDESVARCLTHNLGLRMKRVIAVMCCALVARTVSAQGSVGGVARDRATGSPLPCIDVALLREDSTVVSKTRTFAGGAFSLPAPPAGRYRLRFGGYGWWSVVTALDSLFPTIDQDRTYRLDQPLAIAPADFLGYSDTDADAPPRPRKRNSAPVYPERLARERLEGDAVVRYLVDSLGKVDPKSIEPLLGTDPELFASVKSFLLRTPFVPGRRNFVPVCDLLLQTFGFRIRGQ